MAINKAKRTKAIGALRKAGMSAENAVRHVRYLDLDEPFGPQIEELREDFPTLFDVSDEDDAPDEDDRPMTRNEAIAARLRGNSEHIQRKAYRRTATERPSTASKSAQEAAAHLRKGIGNNAPPTQKWREPVRDINTGDHPAHSQQRPTDSSADRLAARLRGSAS